MEAPPLDSLNSPHASKSYTDNSFLYTSSIDSGVTNLYAKYSYDNGVTSALPATVPVLILMHGYSGDANSLTIADMHRFASYGFFTVAVGMRGRNGASGSIDASGREIYDILDALFYVQSHFGSIVDPVLAYINGYSGGGGNILACLTKCPDYFAGASSFFGISDYGYNSPYGWYYFYSGAPTLLNMDIGLRASYPDAYRARFAQDAILSNIQAGGYLEMFHDTEDPLVSVESSRAINSILSGLPNFNYHESNPSSVIRWLHGHPSDHGELINAESIFIPNLKLKTSWNMPTSGTRVINGWFKSRSLNFEIWLSNSESPRINSVGGRNKVVSLNYNINTKQFIITSITNNTPTYVEIRFGNITQNVIILDGSPIIINF